MPKKQQRNAFYFFMKDLEPQLKREGRVFPNGVADIVPIAHPRWKSLPEKDKARFEDMAKRERLKLRGHGSQDDHRMDNVGNIIAHRKDKYSELEKKRMAERRDMMKNWPAGKDLKSEVFHFIDFQTLGKTYEGEYLPVEVAIVEYSIEKGIIKCFQAFIDPGRIPVGYMFACKEASETTHKIPVEKFELSNDNYRSLWIQIENFINPNQEKPDNPPLYCLGAQDYYLCVESCLEWIYGKTCLGVPNRIRKVYEIESLFQELHSHVGNPVSKSQCIELLTSADWDYEANTRCDYHDKLDVKFCSLGIAKKYAFAISDSICESYDVKLSRHHLPVRGESASITVLSSSSLPPSRKQESRPKSKVDNTFPIRKPKQEKERNQDTQIFEYNTKLRKPDNQDDEGTEDVGAVRCPAPAWGGTLGGGNFTLNLADFPMPGFAGYGAVGRGYNLDLANAVQPVGRGLSIGMQALEITGKTAPPKPSEAPLPPTAWQLGIGRGGPFRAPPLSTTDSNGDNVPFGKSDQVEANAFMLPRSVEFMTQTRAAEQQQFQDVSHNVLMHSHHYEFTGRGRGGILENRLKMGVMPTVPMGRGFAPVDWVDDGSIGPIRR